MRSSYSYTVGMGDSRDWMYAGFRNGGVGEEISGRVAECTRPKS
jgi:hypothetical protein